MTDEALVTPEQDAKAQAGMLAERAWLNDPKSSSNPIERERHVNRYYSHAAVAERAKGQREAARQGAADAEQTEALITPNTRDSRIREAIAARNAELRRTPEGHPRGAQLVDEIALLTRSLPSQRTTAITDDDHRQAMTTGGLSDRAAQDAVLDSLTALGCTEPQKLRFAFALSHSQPEQLDAEQMEARLRDWWRDEYASNYATAQRVWEALTPAARLALTPRRASRDVLDGLLELGRYKR